MKFGFDLDGTLDVPVIREIAAAVLAAGHEVHIITASIEGKPEFSRPAKLAKLDRLKVKYTHLFLAMGYMFDECVAEKARYVQEEKIDFFIDDMFEFCNGVSKENPLVPICHLWPPFPKGRR